MQPVHFPMNRCLLLVAIETELAVDYSGTGEFDGLLFVLLDVRGNTVVQFVKCLVYDCHESSSPSPISRSNFVRTIARNRVSN